MTVSSAVGHGSKPVIQHRKQLNRFSTLSKGNIIISDSICKGFFVNLFGYFYNFWQKHLAQRLNRSHHRRLLLYPSYLSSIFVKKQFSLH
jgi:hypothetical protein